jgi:hypothetical protein
MRLFESRRSYVIMLGVSLLIVGNDWRQYFRPNHHHFPHTTFELVTQVAASLFVAAWAIQLTTRTANGLEKTALVLLAISFGVYLTATMHQLGISWAVVPFNRIAFRVLETAIVLVIATRVFQVFHNPVIESADTPAPC